MPGGFGTLDELFETLVLMQTGKISQFPIVLFGKEYWNKLIKQTEEMKSQATISKEDTDLFLLTDSVEEAMSYILRKLKQKYGGQIMHTQLKSRWWLLEDQPKVLKNSAGHPIKLD
jgi:predicted Rossmann-fold nucleotide-binding protein